MPLLTNNLPYDLQATYFNVGYGACGDHDSNSEHIVAVSRLRPFSDIHDNNGQLARLKSL
jgi:hypothetical protein